MENIMSPTRLRLAEIMRERHLTQRELAEMTGLSKTSIVKLVNNPQAIRLETIDLICQALNIPVSDLIVRQEKA